MLMVRTWFKFDTKIEKNKITKHPKFPTRSKTKTFQEEVARHLLIKLSKIIWI